MKSANLVIISKPRLSSTVINALTVPSINFLTLCSLSLKNGALHPCEKEADPLVIGIASKEENYPIVLGAEPVLITGKIEEGDYIITSDVKGHGKGINPQHIYNKQLFGKIIAQAIESGKGESYTIKAMIRKM